MRRMESLLQNGISRWTRMALQVMTKEVKKLKMKVVTYKDACGYVATTELDFLSYSIMGCDGIGRNCPFLLALGLNSKSEPIVCKQ